MAAGHVSAARASSLRDDDALIRARGWYAARTVTRLAGRNHERARERRCARFASLPAWHSTNARPEPLQPPESSGGSCSTAPPRAGGVARGAAASKWCVPWCVRAEARSIPEWPPGAAARRHLAARLARAGCVASASLRPRCVAGAPPSAPHGAAQRIRVDHCLTRASNAAAHRHHPPEHRRQRRIAPGHQARALLRLARALDAACASRSFLRGALTLLRLRRASADPAAAWTTACSAASPAPPRCAPFAPACVPQSPALTLPPFS